jgi:bifunctional UDP-N-acetylglucosamine pyrophosphorylase/glucosamine-1-phosphate N-acetyltransferase
MSKKPLAVIILAAGRGSRMKSMLPKVMHELAGRPMISWLIDSVEKLGPDKIIVVVGPDMPELEAAVKPHTTVLQKVQDGTGGAVRTALPALKNFAGDVMVLVGDMPLVTTKTLKLLVAAKNADSLTGVAVLGTEMADPSGYGRLIIGEDKHLKKIVEDKDASPKEKQVKIVNTGALCIDGVRLESWIKKIGSNNAQGEYYLTDIPEIAAKEGALTKVAVALNNSEVKGCNSRADLAALESIMQNRLRDETMKSGVTMIDPATVYLHHDTKIARDVLIEPGVFFGPGVEIAEGAHIKAYSHIEGAKIGKGATVGPFARLRPGADIGADVRIGNFVEIKKSKIGKRSKISHFGYVGDTTMGEDVNFGCGAITVNYDGFEKHQTVIGKNVMVGSNVNLVAPLEIDDGAFIAAGSTITENVPADALSISRDPARIREGWAAEFRKRKAVHAQKKKKSSE